MQPQLAQGQAHNARQPDGRAVAKIRIGWGADLDSGMVDDGERLGQEDRVETEVGNYY